MIDKKTKAGVPNVRVYLYVSSSDGVAGASVSATTDAQGTFVAYTRPGKASINIYDLPGNYIRDSQRGSVAVAPQEISGPTELPPIEVVEAAGIEGTVVDESRKAGCRRGDLLRRRKPHGPARPIRSDPQGRFSIKKLSPASPLPIKARTANAVADQTVVKPGEMREPLRLVVSEKKAFVIRGQVVDGNGQPISGAEATLTSHWWIGSTGYGMSLGKCSSDGQGRFEFTGLWAGDRYQIGITKEAFGKYESHDLRGEAGRPHDLGTIVLRAHRASSRAS